MGAFASITWWTAWAWLTISIVGRADDGEVELVGSNFANARDPLPAASRGHCDNGPTQRSACITGSTAPETRDHATSTTTSAINPPLILCSETDARAGPQNDVQLQPNDKRQDKCDEDHQHKRPSVGIWTL